MVKAGEEAGGVGEEPDPARGARPRVRGSTGFRRGVCAPYKIVIPEVTDLSDDAALPTGLQSIAKKHALACGAIFAVNAMHQYGNRRCIAYAGNRESDARELKALLREVCAEFEPRE